MSFYTSLTGLNAATAQLGVTSNNIANVSTVGFKRSRADFGDIFATSPLQKASSTIGQGVSLKRVTQEFGQGNMTFSSNTLDLAISGDGFFPLKSADGFQDIFTRNGSFMMNDQYNVVNSAGQRLMAASVDSSGKANLTDMNVLTIPQKTTGMAQETSLVQLGLNFPADAKVLTKEFNRNDPTSYNKSTALTVYDKGGNGYLATVYYVKTQNASQATPNNKWQTYVYVGDTLVGAALQQATNATGEKLYVNQYGQLQPESKVSDMLVNAKTKMFSLDQLNDVRSSVPASITAGKATHLSTLEGISFPTIPSTPKTLTNASEVTAVAEVQTLTLTGPASAAGTISVAGNSVTVASGDTATTAATSIVAALQTWASAVPGRSVTSDAGVVTITYADTEGDVPDIATDFSAATGLTGVVATTTDGIGAAPAYNDVGEIQTLTFAAPATNTGGSISVGGISVTLNPNASPTDIANAVVTALSSSPAYGPGTNRTVTASNGVVTIQYSDADGDVAPISVSSNAGVLAASPTVATTRVAIAQAAETFTGNGEFLQEGSLSFTTPATGTAVTGIFTKADGQKIKMTGTLNASSGTVFFAKSNNSQVISDDLVYTFKDSAGTDLDLTSGGGTVGENRVVTAGITVNEAVLSATRPHDLSGLFTMSVDGSAPVTIGLENLANSALTLSGTEIAKELTNVINRKFGDEQYFFSPAKSTSSIDQPLKIRVDGSTTPKTIDLSAISLGTDLTTDQVAAEIQKQLNAQITTPKDVVVKFDPVKQNLVFSSASGHTFGIYGSDGAFDLLGVSSTTKLTPDLTTGVFSIAVTPSGDPIQPLKDQRYGMKVEYDTVNEKFVFKSGTTGDQSSIKIDVLKYDADGNITTDGTGTAKAFATGSGSNGEIKGLGLTPSDEKGNAIQYEVLKSAEALRGITSTPAVMMGTPIGINVNNNFTVDLTNNKFVVSVDSVKGVVEIPTGSSYTLDNFIVALQNGINRLTSTPDNPGETGASVSGVKVTYDKATNSLKFTTGTASSDSFIKVTGDSLWGLSNVTGGRGTTSSWIKPTQFTKDVNGVSVAQYIDEFGKDTSSADGFKSLPEWSPVYFDRGELTFDTGGNLVSPKTGSQLDTVYLPDGKGSLTININYSKSTQFSSPFAVLSQSQDGAPEGDLVGLAIGDDGLVNASYSNGAQKSLGKVVLVNFSNPAGLRQIGDTSYYKTSDSGTPKYGEAGSAGFGTVRSGATERANVDLTQELVDLITEQRNFQANAKAIETSTSLTSTIIQIRN
jgi:flagellar hook-basal body protein